MLINLEKKINELKKRKRIWVTLIKGLIKKRNYKESSKCRYIFHLSTPIHGNLGDHAIVYATNKYLIDNFPEYKIIEIYSRDVIGEYFSIRSSINKEDIIVLVGGGNMGNLWLHEEEVRRFVIKYFRKNKIISMPQTISFTSDEEGKKELEKTKKIYNRNKNLVILARENISYKMMKRIFTNKVQLNPDMVLYLAGLFKYDKNNRKNIMICLRNDKESVLHNKNKVIEEIKLSYKNVDIEDTVIEKEILKEDREKELIKMFNKFGQAKVVITDRLHGMVFSAITGTPCIVTKSLDHKVIGTYQWIKDLNYVRLVEELNYENIRVLVDELLDLSHYDEINLNEIYFDKLKEIF